MARIGSVLVAAYIMGTDGPNVANNPPKLPNCLDTRCTTKATQRTEGKNVSVWDLDCSTLKP